MFGLVLVADVVSSRETAVPAQFSIGSHGLYTPLFGFRTTLRANVISHGREKRTHSKIKAFNDILINLVRTYTCNSGNIFILQHFTYTLYQLCTIHNNNNLVTSLVGQRLGQRSRPDITSHTHRANGSRPLKASVRLCIKDTQTKKHTRESVSYTSAHTK